MVTQCSGITSKNQRCKKMINTDANNHAFCHLHSQQLETAQAECPICLEPIISSHVMRTTSCNHAYHTACLQKWLERSHVCPVCRAPLTPPHRDNTFAESRTLFSGSNVVPVIFTVDLGSHLSETNHLGSSLLDVSNELFDFIIDLSYARHQILEANLYTSHQTSES